MSVPSTGRVYGDKEHTPVPYPHYRCRSRVIEARPHAPHSSLTHRCKITVDHPGMHRCICGKDWPHEAEVRA
jgi:hypothetical protein